ncbi:hypothetical protein GCM10009582_12330 [Arthrobacter flavus]
MVAAGTGFGTWLAAVTLLGAGTAMVYPTLLAAIGDVAHPESYGIPAAVAVVALVTALSGLVVALRM